MASENCKDPFRQRCSGGGWVAFGIPLIFIAVTKGDPGRPLLVSAFFGKSCPGCYLANEMVEGRPSCGMIWLAVGRRLPGASHQSTGAES